MPILKAIFRFYIESSIHVSLAICALAGVSVKLYGLQLQWPVFFFLFTASITGYNFVKYAGVAKLHHRSLTNQLKTIQIFSLICFALLIYAAYLQSLRFIITTGILGLCTLCYAVPFLPSHKNLRSLKTLKIFVIGFVWAGTTLWLPLTDQRNLFAFDIFLNTISYFIFVLALILPFEIRDLQFDDPELGTLPQRFGVTRTKQIGYGLLLLFILLTLVNPSLSLTGQLISCGIAVLVGVFTFFTHKKQSIYYTAFWVEAVPIYWFGLIWLFAH